MTGEFALAVHALVYLDHKGTVVSSEELAGNICTNPARVRKVMARLARAGLVTTREGAEGGYAAARPAAALTLREVAEAVDARFVSAGWRPGDEDMDCLVASGMAAAMDALYAELDALCRARLAARTVAEVSGRIFGGGV